MHPFFWVIPRPGRLQLRITNYELSEALPIYDIQAKFHATLRTGNASVVTAPTGSGKSTQIPQWLLKELPPDRTVLVLQPRRLAARMLAERVAWELGGKLGEAVGFVTRFDRAVSAQTRLLFVTEGILTRMLLNPDELGNYGAIAIGAILQPSTGSNSPCTHCKRGEHCCLQSAGYTECKCFKCFKLSAIQRYNFCLSAKLLHNAPRTKATKRQRKPNCSSKFKCKH